MGARPSLLNLGGVWGAGCDSCSLKAPGHVRNLPKPIRIYPKTPESQLALGPPEEGGGKCKVDYNWQVSYYT